jgi:hypothetical protein
VLCLVKPSYIFHALISLLNRRRWALRHNGLTSGIGGLIFPFIMNPLLENVGAPWCYRILGFISLVLGLFASLFMKERFPQKGKKLSDLMHFSVAKESTFLVWIAGADLCLLGYLVPFYLIPSKSQISCLLFVFLF